MGAGFTRRFTETPSIDQLLAIEGVVIIDSAPAGNITGAGTNCAAYVGEAVDMTYACKVLSTGALSSDVRPQEIFGGADLLQKIGGCDPLLGDFADQMGNLFVALRNKRIARLVVAPVDLLNRAGYPTDLQYAVRLWRDLPTNTSATSTTPIVPVTAALVPAGTEFKSGADRFRTASPVAFTAAAPLSTGVDGTTANGVTGATATITRATGSFVTDLVEVGCVVVAGSLNAAAASQNLLCAGAGLLRVTAVNANGLEITCQRMSGGNFTDATDWEAGSALAYRVYPAAVADSGSTVLTGVAGYTVLCRPLDATLTATTAISPTTAAVASSGTAWEPLSGLLLTAHPTGALTFDNQVHGALGSGTNYPNTNATLRARYLDALNALAAEEEPSNIVNVVVCARKDGLIRSYMRQHCLAQAAVGLTRNYCISPDLDQLTMATVIGSADPGAGGVGGAIRDERGWYFWPGCRTFIPELVGVSINCTDGTTTTDGIIDVPMDEWAAALMTELQPELNPGQAGAPVDLAFAPIIGYQRGTPKLKMADYIILKQYGIAALRMDKDVGPIIQSGVTTSLVSGRTNINRRRMADYIQDSIAARYNLFVKKLGTRDRKDAIVSETDAFGADLVSRNNPAAARIDSYVIDDKTGNTPSLEARGIFTVISRWRMLGTLDVLVAQTDVSPTAITTTIL